MNTPKPLDLTNLNDILDDIKTLTDSQSLGPVLLESISLIKPISISDPEVPVFSFHLVSDHAVVGIPVVELSDSFLVAGCAKLSHSPDKRILVHQAFSGNVIRIYKSNIVGQSKLLPMYKVPYLEYVVKFVVKELPDLFTKERLEGVLEFIQTYYEENADKYSPTQSSGEVKSATSIKEEFEKIGVSGVSEFAFTTPKSEKIH